MLCEGKMSILAHFHALWMLRNGRTVLLKCSIFYAWCCAMRWKLNSYIGACAIHSNTSNFINNISNICVAASPTCLSHSRVQIFRDSREGHSLYWWGRGVTQGDIHTHTHLLLCPRFFFLHLIKIISFNIIMCALIRLILPRFRLIHSSAIMVPSLWPNQTFR